MLLIALKLWAWLATDSIALLSSLADSLLDALASLLTLAAVRFAMEPADREHRFGHGKLEAVAGLVQGMIITGSAAYVAFRAFERLVVPEPIESPAIGLAVMLTSLVVTGSLVAFQRYVVRRTQSLAIRADSVHYAADILTNLAVLIAIVLTVQFGWHIADPLLGLVVVVLILNSVRQIVAQSLDVLLDRELPTETRLRVLEIVRAHPRVRGVHDLRTRTSSIDDFIQLHLELDPSLTLTAAHEISTEVERAVRAELPRAEVIIHVDPFGQSAPRDRY